MTLLPYACIAIATFYLIGWLIVPRATFYLIEWLIGKKKVK
jgi:hypothetical protein